MGRELLTAATARRHLDPGQLPLFEQIAQGFLEILSSRQENGDLLDCLCYLDGTVRIEGTLCVRRAVVLAVEELKQKIAAPLNLQSEARAQMDRLKLDPAPELTLYRDIATAILRTDVALRLAKMIKARDASGSRPAFH